MYLEVNLQCLIDQVQYPSLLQANNILQAYPDVFDGIGCFPGPLYQTHVDPSIIPQADSLPPSVSTSKRAIQTRNW